MHTHQFFTWTTHTAEATTLLEAARLQEALHLYMCNIVTEFYLYSIVYIYLINSRLDVTQCSSSFSYNTNFINRYRIFFPFLCYIGIYTTCISVATNKIFTYYVRFLFPRKSQKSYHETLGNNKTGLFEEA